MQTHHHAHPWNPRRMRCHAPGAADQGTSAPGPPSSMSLFSSPPSSTSSPATAGKRRHCLLSPFEHHPRRPSPAELVRQIPVAGKHVVVPGTYNVLDHAVIAALSTSVSPSASPPRAVPSVRLMVTPSSETCCRIWCRSPSPPHQGIATHAADQQVMVRAAGSSESSPPKPNRESLPSPCRRSSSPALGAAAAYRPYRCRPIRRVQAVGSTQPSPSPSPCNRPRSPAPGCRYRRRR